MQDFYRISNLLPANDTVLLNDIYVVLLHARQIPPHLLVSVHGKLFTLSVRGASVDGELPALLQLIRRRQIETIFIRLALPPLFTIDQLKAEIRRCTLAYPRVDAGAITCLAPINDFCHSVYDTERKNVNLIFDLLPRLREKNAMKDCFYLNLPPQVFSRGKEEGLSFDLKKYEVNDVYEAIRKSSLVTA